jgi:hypothetical protein
MAGGQSSTGWQAAYDNQLVGEDGKPLGLAASENHSDESSVTD